jgi:hypothetical protein
MPKKEFDVHFSLNGFFRRVEANNPDKACEIAEKWLKDQLKALEQAARTGLSIEIIEAVDPD